MDEKPIRVLEEPAVAGFVYGTGSIMRSLNAIAAEIARTSIPVLIMGEGGTGKDVYARLIHRLSEHGESKFQKINCVALDSVRLASHLQEACESPNHNDFGTVYLHNLEELDSACQRLLLEFFRR